MIVLSQESIDRFVLLKLLRIAGKPLELFKLQHRYEIKSNVNC